MGNHPITTSKSSKKPTPARKPIEAGNTDQLPLAARISMEGMSSDHTEAATITPDAKPNSVFCKRGDMSFFIKKTNEAPNIVPNNGISNPTVIPMTIKLFAKV